MLDTPCPSKINIAKPEAPPHFYARRNTACQKSISSLLVQTESRRQKHRRNRKNLDSWVKERSKSSSSEEEQILTCVSMEETYSTSATERSVNYLAARMQNVCSESKEDLKNKVKSRRYIFLKNKSTQSHSEREEMEKQIDRVAPEAPNKKDTATETTQVGLIDKENFASPLTGHVYKINIPEVPLPDIRFPKPDKMFDFIKETDLKVLDSTTAESGDTEHQNLLSAVYDAILDSREQPMANYYYDQTYTARKPETPQTETETTIDRNRTAESKTKKLYAAPTMISSTSYCDLSLCSKSYASELQKTHRQHSAAVTTGNRAPMRLNVKRKSISPRSSPRDTMYATSSSSYSPKKRGRMDTPPPAIRNTKKAARSDISHLSSISSGHTTLPIIREDTSTLNFTSKLTNNTNPFLSMRDADRYASSPAQRDVWRRYMADVKEQLKTKNPEKCDINTDSDAFSVSSKATLTKKHCWSVTMNTLDKKRSSNIPVPVNKHVSKNKRRKVN